MYDISRSKQSERRTTPNTHTRACATKLRMHKHVANNHLSLLSTCFDHGIEPTSVCVHLKNNGQVKVIGAGGGGLVTEGATMFLLGQAEHP